MSASDLKRRLTELGDHEVAKDLQEKRDFVKRMMKECWSVYVKYAFGRNEADVLKKIGNSRSEIYHSAKGITIIDSLDTLLLMNMYDEYSMARDWTKNSLHFKPGDHINLFESTIRIFGGLLSAYYLSNEDLFVEKAKEFADLTLPSFSSGIPLNSILLSNHKIRPTHGRVSLSEIGTLHLEYAALSDITKNPIYLQKVMDIRKKIEKEFYSNDRALVVRYSSRDFSGYSNLISIGSEGDSFYEYLIKSHIQNKSDITALTFFMDSIKRLEDNILQKTKNGYYFFPTGYSMEHLACFVGGMYAIASKYVNSELSITYLTRGKELTRTCVDSCLHTTTGLCPDKFNPSDFNSLKSSNVGYYLRPEILESLFYLYRLTGDSQYQELGWKLINSIHEHTRVESGGYSSVLNVNSIPATKNGFQESFFMAETLKYAYLLFSDVNFMSLDKWVYNTEAHPLKIIV